MTTPETSLPRVSLSQNIAGGVILLVGLAFMAWDRYEGINRASSDFRSVMLVAFGAWLIASPTVRAFVREAREVAPGAFARVGGGLARADLPDGLTGVVTREHGPDVVIPDGEPPVEVRQGDPPSDAPRKVARRRRATAEAPLEPPVPVDDSAYERQVISVPTQPIPPAMERDG